MKTNIYHGCLNDLRWTIYRMDFRKAFLHIPNDSLDGIFTSPPYFNQRAYGQIGTNQGNLGMYKYAVTGVPLTDEIGCHEDIQSYLSAISDLFQLSYQKLKDGHFILINISTDRRNYQVLDLSSAFINLAKKAGFIHRDTLIWIKENPRPLPPNSKTYYLDDGWEYILMFSKGKGIIYREQCARPVKTVSCPNCDEEFEQVKNTLPNYLITQVGFTESTSLESKHPAKFPKAVPTFGLSICTQRGDTIYDPFCGIGTTLVAGLELGLNVIGSEISEVFCQSAIVEIQNLKKKG